MNAHLLGFFSGFPSRRFPAVIADKLKNELTIRESLVFISAWPSDYERNDNDSAGMHNMFLEYGIQFKHFCVIDNRTDSADAKKLIQNASCIFLMGGSAVDQFQLICEKEMADNIRNSFAVILGVSAGSINMAKRSLDIWDSDVPYNGLGLADITVKAHVQQDNVELIKKLSHVSEEFNLPILAMEDESAVFVNNGNASFIGQIRLISEGKICPLTLEILNRLI